MKKSGAAFSWIVRLAIVGALAYFLRPLYAPPKGTVPDNLGANDHLSWTFHSATNPAVAQTFTIYGDGRNVLTITRAMGDPDVPELNVNWKVSREKTSGLVQFTREGLLPADKARNILQEALLADALDVKPSPAPPTEQLEINASFGPHQTSATGPQFVASPVALSPNVWMNQIRWQKLGAILNRDPSLKDHLQKKEVILVDDEGRPVNP